MAHALRLVVVFVLSLQTVATENCQDRKRDGCDRLKTGEFCCKGETVKAQSVNISANVIVFYKVRLNEAMLGELTLSPEVKRLSITDCLPDGIKRITKFKSSNSLIELELKNCDINHLSQAVFDNLTSLKLLDLSNNNIGKLKTGYFSKMPALEKLYLNNNNIGELITGQFGNMPALEKLELNRCNIKNISQGAFNNLTSLKSLDLQFNHIRELKTGQFNKIPTLEKLSLFGNMEANVSSRLFDKTNNIKNLDLTDVKLVIKKDTFENLTKLEHLHLQKCKISSIPPGAFDGLKRLKVLNLVYNDLKEFPVFNSPSNLKVLHLGNCNIKHVPAGALDAFPQLVELDLKKNKLTQFPVFSARNIHLKKLYLDNNMIKELNSKNLINISRLEEITLHKNDFKVIPNNFFKRGNEIKILNFSDTPIRTIEENAFVNLTHLRRLTLDGTDIETFPTKGLENLQYLSLKNVKRLFTMPSTMIDTSVKIVVVSKDRSFLCCKFYIAEFRDKTKPSTKFTLTDTTSMPRNYTPTTLNPLTDLTKENFTGFENTTTATKFPTGFSDHWNTTTTKKVVTGKSSTVRKRIEVHTAGTFNPSIPFHRGKPIQVTCRPGPDEFQPCENIMGAQWLTISSFIVAPFAICGNFIVIIVFLGVGKDYNVAKFLVTNLAIADMSLGVYLMSLVIKSEITSGDYYNHVKEFQYGVTCNVLGFLAMFSSILSVYSLTMITVERYLTIVFALYPKRRMMMKHALILMTFGWLIALIVAILPIVGVSNYSKVVLCLPFEIEDGGKYYLLFVFCFNSLSFVFIAFLYTQIYRVVFIQNNSAPTRGNDSRVARRMAILVLTDFACFAPIAVMALSAMFGKSLISVAQSKYLLVFFFPLNSFMNPFLYALITKSFRRDLAAILKNCFVCGERLTGYLTTSLPLRSAHSHTDFLSRTRQSFDFNTMDYNGSANNVHCQSISSLAVSFSKGEPNSVKFHHNENPESATTPQNNS